MTIVTLSDALIKRLAVNDRRILRDRVLTGFCIQMNKRSRTFIVASSSNGVQVRISIGRWPLLCTEEARSIAEKILRNCREGRGTGVSKPEKLPTLRVLISDYAKAKGIKASSLKRYDSILRTHFSDWFDLEITELNSIKFSKHCYVFAKSNGAAIVELGRGLIGAIIRYANAVFSLQLQSPFTKLAETGLMPDKAEPRKRKLQHEELASWYDAVQRLPNKQRNLLMLLAMTGLRRNEGWSIKKKQVDFINGILHIPDTKTGRPHSLPLTPMLRNLLITCCNGMNDEQLLFDGVSGEHLASMAERAGAPKFMLHDLRKMLATTGENLGFSDAVLRRILNHKANKSDVLHRHYVQLSIIDIYDPLVSIQKKLLELMVVKSEQT
ncbi:site-specific integrase [Undibacterium sp. Dicai25W]|uniref:site-specific integrase n=1 Tax=Undibacterium sp. Dicai25W TaxID=3413034 RepID=UPI003BF40E97